MTADPNESLSATFETSAGRAGEQTYPWLEARLSELLETAKAAWPDIELDPTHFVRYLADRIESDAVIERVFAADLYLAAACLAANPRALTVLDGFIEGAAARLPIDHRDPATDELRQATRVKLLLSTGDSLPALASYDGRGPLSSWLRVVMARLLIDGKRVRLREVPTGETETLAEAGVAAADPEVAFLRERYRDDFKEAFGKALAELSERDRGVLRLHVVNRMSIDRLAACCGIGRSTAARWLVGIREQLLEGSRRHLATRLKLPARDAASLIRVLRSDMDVSVVRLLTAKAGPGSSPEST